MTGHRTIVLTLTLSAVLMTVALSSASADSLLSGYGGPGEGNQAILGSALLGGGAGGDGGSSSGASGSAGSSSAGAAGVGAPAGRGNIAPSPSNVRGTTPGRGAGRARGGSRGGKGGASGSGARAYPVVSRETQPTTGATETLGLSAEDLVYVLLALGALAFIGVLMRWLLRASPSRVEGANSSRNAMQDPSN